MSQVLLFTQEQINQQKKYVVTDCPEVTVSWQFSAQNSYNYESSDQALINLPTVGSASLERDTRGSA